jgi:choline transport protein
MVNLIHPESLTKYQNWLIYVAYYLSAAGLNIFFSKRLAQMNNILMLFSIIGFGATFLIILAMHASEFRENQLVWTNYANSTGWPSDWLTFMLAVGNSIFSLLGADGATHLVDEAVLPAKYISQAMVPSFMSFITAWPFAIAFVYVTSDIESVVNSSNPIAQIYYASTNNRGVTAL